MKGWINANGHVWAQRDKIIRETHDWKEGGINWRYAMTQKILLSRLWWPNIYNDSKLNTKNYDIWERIRWPPARAEMPLQLV